MDLDRGEIVIQRISNGLHEVGIDTGSPVNDLIFVCIVLAGAAFFLALILYVRQRASGRGRDGEGFDRMGGVLGRLEKLEMTINQFKTDTARSFEMFRGDVGYLKQDLDDIKQAVSGGEYGRGAGSQSASAAVQREQNYSNTSMVESVAVERKPVIVAPPVRSDPLAAKLAKTRNSFFSFMKQIFASKPLVSQEMLEEIEIQLVSADMGVQTARILIEDVKRDIEIGAQVDQNALAGIFKMKILQLLETNATIDTEINPIRRAGEPLVVMMVGVNGVGKTTTTAKLAAKWKDAGAKVLMVAADTFRAAAVEQLVEWGNRIGVAVVSGAADAKPSTVVFDAMQRAKAEGVDVVIIDTAGRLHTKSNLMQELEGVRNVIQKVDPTAPHETILVLDGTTGVNALSQAKEFNQAVPLTGLIITKLDGTPKGGIIIAIKNELGIPVRYLGVGEAKEDLRHFVAREFVEALFSLPEEEGVSVNGETRRRRRGSSGSLDRAVEG